MIAFGRPADRRSPASGVDDPEMIMTGRPMATAQSVAG